MGNIDYSKISEITVKTQAELDAIPQNFKGKIYIDCGANDWIKIRHSYYYPVVVKGNSSVVVCVFPPVVNDFPDFPTVEAYDKSAIVLNGYSFVKAYGQSTVEAYENSTVEAFEKSTVRAFDKSSVKAYEDSFAVLYDDSSARAFDNSSVRAFGNSLVRAFNKSFVEAFDHSSVGAFDNSSVEAWEYVAVRAYGDSSIRAFGNAQVVDFVQGAKIEVFDNARKVFGILKNSIRSKNMNEKLFNFFSKKVGSAKIDGREYAFCHPLNLEISEKGEVIVACTAVDRAGNFYDFCWLPWADFSDNWGNPVIKRNRKYIRVGKYERLLVKDIEELISYLERRKL